LNAFCFLGSAPTGRMRKRILFGRFPKTIVTWLRIRKIMSYVRKVIWFDQLSKTRMVIRIRVKTKKIFILFLKNHARHVPMLFSWPQFVLCLPYRVSQTIKNFLPCPDPDPHPASCSNLVFLYRMNFFNTAPASREGHRYRHRYFVFFFLLGRIIFSDICTGRAGISAGTGTRCCLQLVRRVHYLNIGTGRCRYW
jgi:hypothetical protein